ACLFPHPHALGHREVGDKLRRPVEGEDLEVADLTGHRVEEQLAVEAGSIRQGIGTDGASRVRIDHVRINPVDDAVDVANAEELFEIARAEAGSRRLIERARRAIERSTLGENRNRRAALPVNDRAGFPPAEDDVPRTAAIQPPLAEAEWQVG